MVYIGLFSSVLFYKQKRFDNSFPISVLICARNESENLLKNIPLIAEQDYANFEIVIVDDGSEDNTSEVLNLLKNRYGHIQTYLFKQNQFSKPGKKEVLSYAIEKSKNEFLLLTDADCKPNSSQWIQSIVNTYSPVTEVVAGYGAYIYQKGFLNALIRTETILTALQYFAFAILGLPYMGVGRNLSYKKTTFFSGGGFQGHYDTISGDDDLFVQNVANKKNTKISLLPESITLSKAETSFIDWLKQKKRHLSAGFKYRIFIKLLLVLEPLSKAVFISAIILTLIFTETLLLPILLYLFRLGFLYVLTNTFSKRIEGKSISFFIPIFDVLLPILIFVLILTNIFFKKPEWK
jgi:cellulose synthase/poly-beta-1,6-N-acetylglucosamine synthase-like glycosyltransferase